MKDHKPGRLAVLLEGYEPYDTVKMKWASSTIIPWRILTLNFQSCHGGKCAREDNSATVGVCVCVCVHVHMLMCVHVCEQ